MKRTTHSIEKAERNVNILIYTLIVLIVAFTLFGVPGIIVGTGCNAMTTNTVVGDVPKDAHVLETIDYTIVERVINTKNDTLRLYCTDTNGNDKAFTVPYNSQLKVGDTIVETSYEIVTGYWGLVLRMLVIWAIVSLGMILYLRFSERRKTK